MRNFLKFIWEKHRKASLALGAALVVLAIFVGEFASEAIYFANPGNQDRPLELWMSPRFVGKSWDLPKPVIFEIMQMDMDAPPKEGPRTLADVLVRTGMTLEELQNQVETAEREMRGRRNK